MKIGESKKMRHHGGGVTVDIIVRSSRIRSCTVVVAATEEVPSMTGIRLGGGMNAHGGGKGRVG